MIAALIVTTYFLAVWFIARFCALASIQWEDAASQGQARLNAVGPTPAAPSSLLDRVWLAEVERRAAKGRAAMDRLWQELRGETLRPFRESGMPSPLTQWDRFSPQDKHAILVADTNRIFNQHAEPEDDEDIYADGDIVSDIVEHRDANPPERPDGEDPEPWSEDEDV